MKKFFMVLVAVIFPWLILLLNDNPGGAIVALIMQASIIAWIPASVWAYRVYKEGSNQGVGKKGGSSQEAKSEPTRE